MLQTILNHRAKNINSAAFILAIAGIASKVLGLCRDRILAGIFGAGDDLDIYFTAFRIPDLLFNILILGAVSSAFIPVFATRWVKNKEDAWRLCNNVLCIFLFFLVFFSVILVFFAPFLMKFIAPGFEKEKMDMAITLTRIMLLSPIILGISNILGSILQYFSKFFVYALSPIMYNIGIILGAVFFVPDMGVKGLAFGVVLGAILHFLIQVPIVFLSGYKFKIVFDFRDKGFLKIIKLMIPRTIGIVAGQINLIVITAIASTLAVGSIAVFNFSSNLQYIPISLFGISFSVAAFPYFSKNYKKKNSDLFISKFKSVFSQILFLSVPSSLIFFLLRAHIVRIVLGTGEFSWQDTRLTAACIALFSISIFAQSLIPLIAKAFYAIKDTKTPVKISIFSILANIFFSFTFVFILQKKNIFYDFFQFFLKLEGVQEISVIGLTLAFSVSSIINFILLFYAFKKKIGNGLDSDLRNSFLRILLLSLFCGILAFSILRLSSLIFNLDSFLKVVFQAVFSAGTSIIFYLYFAKKLKFKEYDSLFGVKK